MAGERLESRRSGVDFGSGWSGESTVDEAAPHLLAAGENPPRCLVHVGPVPEGAGEPPARSADGVLKKPVQRADDRLNLVAIEPRLLRGLNKPPDMATDLIGPGLRLNERSHRPHQHYE